MILPNQAFEGIANPGLAHPQRRRSTTYEMKADKAERKIVSTWAGYLEREPTLPRLLGRSWKVFAFRIVAIALLVWFFAEARFKATAFFAVGMLLGSLVRDVEWLRKNAKVWPIVRKYLDWEKIRSVHAESHSGSRANPVEPGGGV